MSDICSMTINCAGHVVDGFCDVCGMQPTGSVPVGQTQSDTVRAGTGRTGSARTGSTRTGSTQLSGKTARGSRRTGSSRRGSSRRLGLGLVDVPEVPKLDPVATLMPEAKVPENKRFCAGAREGGKPCEVSLTREKCTKCGHATEYTGTPRDACQKCGGKCELIAREKGFCSVCGTPYDFRPKLHPGDMLDEQYQVLGCLAFGGMGWIYLAKDVTLNRYVVLKGLLNSSDPNLAKAAVAERQFLAEVKHPNIVGVYTCVSDTRSLDGKTITQAYTVMEYVGGVTLKSLRKDRGPLPVAEVLAYMHPVLVALGYMHDSGLIYNDFKPDNVMLENADIKIIDLGGVCRATQTDGDVYSTIGYAAPEVSSEGPSFTSDLYSVARSIAVMVTEFKSFQSSYKFKLRSALEEPVFQKYDSLYRLLQKACHENPNMRFQSAEEMAEQVHGVLREVVAIDSGKAHPVESKVFGPDTLGVRAAGDTGGVHVLDIDSLPSLKMDASDPATAFILGNLGSGALSRQVPVLMQAVSRFPNSIEAHLAMAKNQVHLGQYEEAEKYLAKVEQIDPFEWRVIWLRGLALLGQKAPKEAVDAFETCYAEMPGELAPKLGIAVAAELTGDAERAIRYYEVVSRTDAGYATAVFGLSRCLCAKGARDQAVNALGAIPQTSSLYAEAQKAIAAALMRASPVDPGPAELAKASATVEALMLEGVERFTLARDLFAVALALLGTGKLKPAPDVKLFGQSLEDTSVRLGLEGAYRNLARLSENEIERIALVDMANQVRPKTFL